MLTELLISAAVLAQDPTPMEWPMKQYAVTECNPLETKPKKNRAERRKDGKDKKKS